ncbi:bifunctional metallophosphatase/5'-nucleotidase [Virgibacillus salarius]
MQNNTAKLTILYTSDVHGHVMPIHYGTNEKANLGLAKYATVVKQTRKKSDHVIVLDNGDLIQGTPLMTHYVKQHTDKENPMIKTMNTINIDAGVIGNHEFNFGSNILADAINQSNFPWLSANIIDKETGRPKYGPPYTIKTFANDIKVAIIGITTHYIPNWESADHIKGILFKDALNTLKEWVPYIQQKEQPDILIVCYHGGFEKDLETGEPTESLTGENQGYDMCEIEGIDILLTGHQHRKITGRINDVLVVQPGNNAAAYGEVEINLEKVANHWCIRNKKAFIRPLEHIRDDKEIMSNMAFLEESTQKWLDQPIGYIEGDMTIDEPFHARINKHPFIEFIQKVQMEASGADISVTSLLNNESTGFSSTVTMRDIVSNYMYPNTLVVLELTGKDIKAALEKSAEYFILDDQGIVTVNPVFEHPKPQHYNYDMWEGIHYTINVSMPIGQRIEGLTYHNQPVADTKKYPVVLNNYRASGGGDYTMFTNKPIIKEIQKDAVEIIREYFERYHTVKATKTDNFKVKPVKRGWDITSLEK